MNQCLSRATATPRAGALRFPNIGGKSEKPDFSRVKPTYPTIILN